MRSRSPALLAAAVLLAGCGGTDEPAPATTSASAPPSGLADLQELEVVHIVDGDTLHARLREDGPAGRRGAEVTVRLLEVDTPEVEREDRPGECYGEEATEALAEALPPGATAYAEPDRELHDQYGRTLLYLYREDPDGAGPLFVNHWLVAEGYATSVLFEPNDRHIALMRAAEREAQRAGRGLWGACR